MRKAVWPQGQTKAPHAANARDQNVIVSFFLMFTLCQIMSFFLSASTATRVIKRSTTQSPIPSTSRCTQRSGRGCAMYATTGEKLEKHIVISLVLFHFVILII